MAYFTSITTRRNKGIPLSYDEMDDNLENLQYASAPIGSMMLYAANTIEDLPLTDTWAYCHGQILEQADYPELYDVLQLDYTNPDLIDDGSVDPQTQFMIPWTQGMFLRMRNQGVPLASLDPDREGLTGYEAYPQTYAVHSHHHDYEGVGYKNAKDGVGGKAWMPAGHNDGLQNPPVGQTEDRGGKETRPDNVSLNLIIKLANKHTDAGILSA